MPCCSAASASVGSAPGAAAAAASSAGGSAGAGRGIVSSEQQHGMRALPLPSPAPGMVGEKPGGCIPADP